MWEPIADLPQDWSGLTDGELGPLLQFWNDQRADLEQSGALAEFNKRLGREWSIETGQIEGVYNLDRGLTETLIEKGIDSDLIPNQLGQRPPEIIAAIIQDHADVLEGLFQFVKGDRPLSKGYIHELHAALLRHQDTTAVRDQFGNLFEAKLLKGKYKERPNNPKKPDGSMHQYCPPEQVDSEMEKLLSFHAEHEKKGAPVEVEAAWLHHRFTQIHPYQDGNGRVARALASLLFIKAGWLPVVVTRDDRAEYTDSLQAADEGALGSLVSFFVLAQKREIGKAVRAFPKPTLTVAQVIAAARNPLLPDKRSDPAVWVNTKDIADKLIAFAETRLEEIKKVLEGEIGQAKISVTLSHVKPLFPELLLLPYERNTDVYHEAKALSMGGQNAYGFPDWSHFEIHAQAIGSKFLGLIGFVAVFIKSGNARRISKDFFQVNHAESHESAERRFRPWLEESLVNALTLWRKNL
jgi:hypothetical protein